MSNRAEKPRLSIVIPTLGRPVLIKTLKSLVVAEGIEDAEVFVAGAIAEGPVLSDLRRLQEAHPQIRHLEVSFDSGDSSRKKNAGAEESTADIIAFLDDDVVVAPDWPLRIVEPFEDENVGLVSGPSLVPEDVSLFARLAAVALQSKAAGYVADRYLQGDPEPREIRWSRIIGCNMAYRKTVLEEIGRFDPEFWPGEEMIAAYKTGRKYRLMFHPGACLYHYPRSSLLRFWKQMHGYGATRIRLIRGGVDFEPTTIVPGAWIFSLVVLGIGALFSRICLVLLLLDLLLYLAADAWITLAKLADTRRASDLLIFLLIPIMHISYGIAEWIEFFRPNKDLSEKTRT